MEPSVSVKIKQGEHPMHNKGMVVRVGVLAGTLMIAEIAANTDWQERSDCSTHSTLSTALFPTAPENPHTHFEAEGQFANTSSPYFASGGQYVADSYEVTLQPHFGRNADGQSTVLWIDALGTPDGLSGMQRMYRRFESLDELSNTLARRPEYFPEARLESIRETVSKGMTKIGGSHAPVRFFFSETQLIELGMSFRPLDG
jgi:hypothetical protein